MWMQRCDTSLWNSYYPPQFIGVTTYVIANYFANNPWFTRYDFSFVRLYKYLSVVTKQAVQAVPNITLGQNI